MHLSTVDRLISKLGPVNALVENLCKRLLPNEVAHAVECLAGRQFICDSDWGCGVRTGSTDAWYCVGDGGQWVFLQCGCGQ